MSQHTPKPWIAKPDPDGIVVAGRDPEYPNLEEAVALIFRGGLVGRDGRYKHNASLIETAPRLLEAAEAAVAALTQNETHPADVEAACKWLRVAITEAKRGQ